MIKRNKFGQFVKGTTSINKGVEMNNSQKTKLSIAHKGKKFSEESRRKMSIARSGVSLTKKHRDNVSKGLMGHKVSEETRKKMSFSKRGEKCSSWKGDDVKYGAIHNWLRKNFKKEKCESLNCESGRKLEFAKITGLKYERKRENFIVLCHKCHRIYDIKNNYK